MHTIPKIGEPGENDSFHDSSLIEFSYLPAEEGLVGVLSVPNEFDVQEGWRVCMSGVLAIELESLGDGESKGDSIPPEVYAVYDEPNGSIALRWKTHLRQAGVVDPRVHVITFASSFLRGWGENSELEGIRVVCREVAVGQVRLSDYNCKSIVRPRIEDS